MSDETAYAMLTGMLAALDLPKSASSRVRFVGAERLPSCFPVSELAAASIAAAATAVTELAGLFSAVPPVSVSYRAASLWFGWSIQPLGWEMPNPWDAIAGDYKTVDGWIKLHTNAPHHRVAALSVLRCDPDRDRVADMIATWRGDDLEAAIVEAGGCAARLRSVEEWANHSQGKAVAAEPLIHWNTSSQEVFGEWRPSPDRPLSGLRVLDLTRVLAGPVATRFLAGFGAEILRIDPPAGMNPASFPKSRWASAAPALTSKLLPDAKPSGGCLARRIFWSTAIAAMHSKDWGSVPRHGKPSVQVSSTYRSMPMVTVDHGRGAAALTASSSFHRGLRRRAWHGETQMLRSRFRCRHSIMPRAISWPQRPCGA